MSYTLTVRLDAKLAARLAAAAGRRRQPVSVVARDAVSAYLDRDPRRATTLLAAAGTHAGRGVAATNETVRAVFAKRRR